MTRHSALLQEMAAKVRIGIDILHEHITESAKNVSQETDEFDVDFYL